MLQLSIRPEEVEILNVENLHYNWIVTRRLGHHPPAQTKLTLSACEDFIYDF